jgi:hypothetical protein
MDSSFDEAFRLFRKWETDASLITILLRTSEGGASCFGRITALSPDLMVVCAPYFNNEPSNNNVAIYLDSVKRIRYEDSRTIPYTPIRTVVEHIVTLELGSAITATIYKAPEE